jgi:hypothetical protein
MPAGVQVFNTFGTLQLSDMFANFHCTDKGTATASSKYNNVFGQQLGYTIQVAVPNRTGYAPIFAIRSNSVPVVVLGVSPLDTATNTWKFWVCSSYNEANPPTFEWFAFNPITGPVGNYGLQVWDAAGNLTYDSSAKLLKIEYKVSGTYGGGGNGLTDAFPVGPKYAVADLQHTSWYSPPVQTGGIGDAWSTFSFAGLIKTIATGFELTHPQYMLTRQSMYPGAGGGYSYPYAYLLLDVTGY